MTGRIHSVGNKLVNRAPSHDPTNAVTEAGAAVRQGICTCCEYRQAAEAVPNTEENLLVPNKLAGVEVFRLLNNAGICINPPPPTTESTNPAIKDIKIRKDKVYNGICSIS
jgi:hypothetical protein